MEEEVQNQTLEQPEIPPVAMEEVPVVPLQRDTEALEASVAVNKGMSAEELAIYFPDFTVAEIHEARKRVLGF